MVRTVVAGLLVAALLVPVAGGGPAAAAATSCKVTDTGTGDTYASLQDGVSDADPNQPLTLTFTGTCREHLYIGRSEPTTIIGKRTRSSGPPTLDASGAGDAAVTIYANTVVLKGFTVTGGAASGDGGGLYIDSTPVSLIDMTIHHNESIGGRGGGVYSAAVLGKVIPSVPDPVLVIGGRTVIRDNSAIDDGGGVFAGEGIVVRMTGRARLEGNSTLGSGGGIYIDNGSLSLIGAVSIVENSATVLGGGVGVFGLVTGGDLVSRKASGQRTPPTIRGNGASQAGGVFYMSDGVLNLADLVVTGNRADGPGAGMGILRTATDTAVLRDVRITGNRAAKGDGTATSGVGAGLEVQSGTKLRFEGGIIAGNRTNGSGGGIFARTNAELTFVGTTVRGNRAVGGAGIVAAGAQLQAEGATAIVKNKATGDGGGITVTGATGTVTLASGTVRVTGNTASNGAGIYSMSGTVFVSADATVAENEATNTGGGIWAQGGDVLMDGTLRANAAAGSGGGLYATNTNVTIMGGKVLANTAGQGGAGLRLSAVVGKTQSIGNGTIRGNVAEQDGGGIALQGGTLAIAGTIIEKNLARGFGGVSVGGTNVALTMENGAIRLNRTSSQDGAGIGILDGTATLDGVAVTGNKSVRDVGGVYVGNATIDLVGGTTVTGNTAARFVGGVFVATLSSFPCTGISGNAPTNVVGQGGVLICP